MRINKTPVIAHDPDGAQHYVITLSERNVASLYHQVHVSRTGGDQDTPRQAYGSLHKRTTLGDFLVITVEPDDQHYGEDGLAR